MKKLFLLSKEDVKLAAAEAIELIKPKEYQLYKNLLIADTQFNDYERLAYTKTVYQLLFITTKRNLKKDIEKFDWQSIYKKDFCIRKFDIPESERKLAGYIWNKLKNPKVNLKDATTVIHIFRLRSHYFCCNLIKDIPYTYDERKPHNRPALHPSSLHPRLARASINLTGIKKGKIVDPFCGSGGILIEAGLLGLNPIGYDNDPSMIERADKNLKHFKIKNYSLELKDSTLLNKPINYLVTDLPYGRNTPSSNLKRTYEFFLESLEKILKKKAVIMFPDFINVKKMINKDVFEIENEFTQYLHKSLSKKIIIIKKK